MNNDLVSVTYLCRTIQEVRNAQQWFGYDWQLSEPDSVMFQIWDTVRPLFIANRLMMEPLVRLESFVIPRLCVERVRIPCNLLDIVLLDLACPSEGHCELYIRNKTLRPRIECRVHSVVDYRTIFRTDEEKSLRRLVGDLIDRVGTSAISYVIAAGTSWLLFIEEENPILANKVFLSALRGLADA